MISLKESDARLQSEITSSGLTRKEWYRTIYLRSDHWKELRAQAFEAHGRKCAKCPSTTNLDVHHLRYGLIFDVTPKDLQILCRPCHDKEHAPAPQKPKKVKESKTPNAMYFGRKVGKKTQRYFSGSLEEQLAQVRNLLANSQGLTTGDMASLTRKKRKLLKSIRKLQGPKKKNR
jgi:hypothetical protein